jgi:hypothetical protein
VVPWAVELFIKVWFVPKLKMKGMPGIFKILIYSIEYEQKSISALLEFQRTAESTDF